MDITDLTHSLNYGNTIADAASMLCRDDDEVRQKTKELGLVEHATPSSGRRMTCRHSSARIAHSRVRLSRSMTAAGTSATARSQAAAAEPLPRPVTPSLPPRPILEFLVAKKA
jgi:hypothetical protein